MSFLAVARSGPDLRQPMPWILGGIATGVLVAFAVSAFRPVLVVLAVFGLLAFLPTLFIKEVKRYWIVLYIISLLLAVNKRLTKDLIHPVDLLMRFGLPPTGNLSIDLYPSDLILLALMMVWILRVANRKEVFYFPKVTYFAVAYFGWAIISSLIKAPSLYLSAFELARQGMYFLTFLYIANNVNTRKLARGIIFACMLGLCVEAVAIIVSYGLGSYPFVFEGFYRSERDIADLGESYNTETKPGEEMIVRSRGTFNHPGGAALYLEFMLPLAAALFLAIPGWKKKLMYLALFALGMTGLFLTFSRAAFLGAAFGLVLTVWLVRKRNLHSRWQYKAVLVLAAIGTLAASPKLYTYLTARPKSFSYRFVLIGKGIDMFLANPILGVGLNNSSAANPEFWLKLRAEGGVSLALIHNQYLLTAIELGVIGFIVFMGFFVVTGVQAYRCSRSDDREVAILSIGIWGTYLAVALHVTADPFGTNTLTSMLWLFAGVIAAFTKMAGERTAAEPAKTPSDSPLTGLLPEVRSSKAGNP